MVMSKTLFKMWIHQGSLKNLCESTNGTKNDSVEESKSMTSSAPITNMLCKNWLNHLNESSPGRWNYTMEDSHKGHYYVHFRLVALFVALDQLDGIPDTFNAISSLHYQLILRKNPPQTIECFALKLKPFPFLWCIIWLVPSFTQTLSP
ncbi:hypothetical protein VP01_2094g4 [Puccinia sorghi]|uniref:Uncharacterized protein n=1 Tax=Puccinia sorghi TaxID=27349 RepID=A0A0L6VAV8_9BASI|nr:hypothetical protein VP01_2094g4 [Puccinia sorghi]